MSSMNVSLPESMRRWIESIVSGEGYGTTSEYIRALVREDQKKRAREELDAKLLHALDSSTATELSSDDWARVRQTVRNEIKKKGTA